VLIARQTLWSLLSSVHHFSTPSFKFFDRHCFSFQCLVLHDTPGCTLCSCNFWSFLGWILFPGNLCHIRREFYSWTVE